LGLECWFDQSLLKPQNIGELLELQFDDGHKENVTVDQLQSAYFENSGLFQLLDDIESGAVHFSFSEYQSLPAKFQDVRRMFNRLKLAKRQR